VLALYLVRCFDNYCCLGAWHPIAGALQVFRERD
jgi:hypothetical protein